ncbi:hypothetical protein L195_g062770, partial [Trifolium pratense]
MIPSGLFDRKPDFVFEHVFDFTNLPRSAVFLFDCCGLPRIFSKEVKGMESEDLALPYLVAIFSGCGVLDFARFARADG